MKDKYRLETIKSLLKKEILNLSDYKTILQEESTNLITNFFNIYSELIVHCGLDINKIDYRYLHNLKDLIIQALNDSNEFNNSHIIHKIKSLFTKMNNLEFKLQQNNIYNKEWQCLINKLNYDIQELYDIMISRELEGTELEQYELIHSLIFELENKTYLYRILEKYPYLINVTNQYNEHIIVEIIKTFVNKVTESNNDFSAIIYYSDIIDKFINNPRFRIKDESSRIEINNIINETYQILDNSDIKDVKQKKLFLDSIVSVFEDSKGKYQDLKQINHKYNISNGFNSSIQKEIGFIKDIKKCNNFITIDSEDTRDMDDAISLTKVEDYYIVEVCISDVEYFIKEGTNLDIEARKRASTIYLSDNIIPMLPFELSNELLSLNNYDYKPVICYRFFIDDNGEIFGNNIYRKSILINHRLSYKEIDDILKGNSSELPKKTIEMIYQLSYLANKLRTNNTAKLNYREIKELRAHPTDHASSSSLANIIIEEFMILTNYISAMELANKNLPCIYRVHANPEDTPEYSRLVELEKKIRSGKETMFVQDYQKIMKELVNLYPKAYYSIDNIGHFGLNLDYYAHATSPIRRYSDIVVQRLINDLIFQYPTDEVVKTWEEKLPQICEELNSQTFVNDAYQNEYERYKTLSLVKGGN